ncbi:MAG: hypothetical protein KY453_04750 [Gemmatimonadetes bacterium]|nr:hypothetical protein [Gemmatimonadota bacterium]
MIPSSPPSPARASSRAPLLLLLALAAAAPPSAAAQQDAGPALAPVSVTFEETALRDVVRFFAAYAGRSIVVGRGVEGVVSADIQRQPWDVALAAILDSQGLTGREMESGIILVESPDAVTGATEPVVTRVFRLSYVQAAELQPAVQTLLSERGAVAVLPGINALVVTDAPEVIGRVGALLGG